MTPSGATLSPAFFIGSAVPQSDPALLDRAVGLLEEFDAVIGPAADGDGWWAFGVREPRHADQLGVLPETFPALALAALRLGLHVAMLPPAAAAGR
jgi:uncharacterized protein